MLLKLKQEHVKICGTIEQMMNVAEPNRKQQFYRLREELILHMTLEEKLLHPMLKESDESHDRMLESCEEHREVKHQLELLGKALADTATWQKLLDALQENLRRHIREEEQGIFSRAERMLRTGPENSPTEAEPASARTLH